MEAILSFFEGIGDAITAVIDFVISFFQDTVTMITLLVNAVANIPNYFSWLPAPLLVILVALFAIVVTYKILGREG